MFGLENSGFLISLAVSLLISLVTLLYFRQQIATIDHKVASMFSLLTSLTQELNNLSRISFNQQTLADTEDNSPITLNVTDSRINVSDDENSESGDDSDSSDGEEDENMSDEDESEEMSLAEFKTLNMGSEVQSSIHNTNDIKIIDMDTYSDEESSHNDDDESYDYGKQLEDVMNDMIEETIELNNEMTPTQVTENTNITQLVADFDAVDTDSLPDLEIISDVKTFNIPLDYSKMSVKALKDLVAEKNLTTNVSKLKKPELIKLLSV